MKVLGLALALMLSLPNQTHKPQPYTSGGWCCLCECGSKDQNQCHTYCTKRQHGHDIINEPEIKTCSKKCIRKFNGKVPQ